MRKLKLLMATLAMIVGGVNCAWADVNYTASFANANANWTGSDGAKKNTTPSAGGITMSECYYEAYGTGSAMKQTAYVPNGYYDVEVYAQAHHAWLADFDASTMTNVNTLYVNSSSQKVPTVDNTGFTSDEPTLYTFTNVAVTDGTLTINLNRDANGANWFTMNVKSVTLKTMATDATSHITNPDFSESTWSEGWTGTGSDKANAFVSQTNGSFTGAFAEMWVQKSTSMGAADLNQTITLPAGIYTLSAKVQAGIECELYASISGNEQIHTCNGSISSQSLTFYVDADNTSVKIGLRHKGITSPSNSVWVAVDQFRLMRHGDTNNADLTDKVINWNFQGSDGWTKTTPNGGNSGNYGTTAVEYWISTAANGSFDYYQDLSGLPNGKYNLSASMWNTFSANGSGTAASGECGVYGTSSFNADFAGVTSDSNGANLATYATTNGVVVTDGTLRVGVKNNETMKAQWFGVDWIKLNYIGLAIVNEAVEFTSGNETIADTWYYYDLPTNDDYEFTSSNAATLTYTTDGTQLLSGATGTGSEFTAEETKTISLSAGRIYFKTSAATTLTVSYKYSVSKATADLNYIQKDNIVTVSFAVSSNEPGVTLSQNYSGVTFGGDPISVTPTASGFTFTVPTVTAANDYTLSIPAGAIGYASGRTFNEAQNIVLKTPTIFDGYYFLRTSEYKYLSRGGNYNTQAIADNYGIPMRVTTNTNNITEFIFVDNWFHLFDGNGGTLYTDNNTYPNFEVEATEGGYYVINRNTTSNSTYGGKMYIDTADGNRVKSSMSNATVWLFEDATTDAHKIQMQKLKDAQASVVASSAGITASTQADMASQLTANYVGTPITITGTGGTNSQSWQKGGGNSIAGDPLEIFKETVSGLTPGLYCLSVKALERITWYNDVANVGGAAGLTYVYANDQKVQLNSLFDYSADASLATGDVEINGKYYPDTQSSAQVYFNAGKYKNDVYVWVVDEGEGTGSITFGINKPHRYANDGNRGAWICYNDFTLTYYEAKATEEEKQALAEAISNHVIGFEKDEYAPYNNIGLEGVLANANGIDPDNVSGAEVVAATNALTAATWTANTEEMNAIYDGTFANAENNGAPAGWVTDHTAGLGGEYHARAFVGDSHLSVFGNETNSAFYQRWDNTNSTFNTVYTYGATDGYTMPLKAAVYRMKGQLGVWSNDGAQKGRNIKVYITDAEGNEIAAQTVTESSGTPVSSESGEIVEFNFLVPVTAVGNYKFNITNVSNGSTAVVLSNLELKKAVAEPVTMDEIKAYEPAYTYANVTLKRKFTADVWNTFCVPFDIDNASLKAQFGDEVAVSTAALTAEAVTFTPMNEPAITANTPVIIKVPNASATEFTFNGVMIKTGDAKVTGTNAEFVGNYAGKITLPAENCYYIAQNKLKKATGTQTMKGFRAYFTTVSGARLSMIIDGEDTTTSIDGVEVAPLKEGSVYNLNGQRVDKAQKGLYIVNGKKVVVK